MAKVLLLDGNSLLYRGFFAMRALTTSSGQQTQAVYSLTMMLLLALEREKPDGILCAWDAPVATFRHQELETYKGTRQAAPDELRSQMPIARELITAFRIPMLELPGWEADDIIGTMAEKCKTAKNEVLIVTGDLDALQLVDDKQGPVRVMTTSRGVTETVIYDEEAVRNRFALSPAQLIDYKGLKGDNSDNLPGVPGIGDKTASKLIGEFGTLENLLAKIDSVGSPKLQQLLTEYREQAEQCKHLATIVRDIPEMAAFELPLDYKKTGADVNAVADLFERLEFRTLIRRIPGIDSRSRAASPPPAPPPMPAAATEARQTSMDLFAEDVAASDEPAPSSADSSEAIGAGVYLELAGNPDRPDIMTAVPVALHVTTSAGIERVDWADIESRRAWLEDETATKVVYDLKLVYGILLRNGITLRGVVLDVLLAAYLLNAGRSAYHLQDLIQEQIGIACGKEDPAGLARGLRAVGPILRKRLEIDGLDRIHDRIELPLSPIIARMELHGVAIDTARMAEMSSRLNFEVTGLEREIHDLAGGEPFTIGSTKQLQTVLFEKLGLPTGKKTKTGYSTDSEVLEGLASLGYEIAAKILSWRELTKLKTQYADNLPALISPLDGRIHTTLSQSVAATGRLSSSNPNLQNIPIKTEIGREIRRGFVASPGNCLLAADYSQIELRIFAHVTRDPELMRTFAADEDIHRRTASLVFGTTEEAVTADQRRRAKTINFAVIYGMGDFRLAIELGVNRVIASDWKKRYFANYPEVRRYADQVVLDARERGYVTTLSGRRRYTPDINSRVMQFRQAAEREAVNMPVQGTAADVIKLAMIEVDRELAKSGLSASMVLQVHDELLFEAPEAEIPALAALVRRCMEGAYPLDDVPLKVEVRYGQNWADMAAI